MKKKYLKYFLIFIICAMASGALVYSILHLMTAYQDYEDSQGVYEELEDDFTERPDVQDESKADSDEGEYEYLQIDFEGLRAVNPDVIAWIDIPGAKISYPVLQGEDNSYYLTHLASGEYGISGSIFVDYNNHPDFSDQNTIIYGHNMKDDSMFGRLDVYQEENMYRSEPYFYLYMPGQIYVYRVISAYEGYSNGIAYMFGFANEVNFLSFEQEILEQSNYDTGTVLSGDEKIVTLSTCTGHGSERRFIVHGKWAKTVSEE